MDRLQAADAVLFDDLSSGPILAHARPGPIWSAVGKRAGRASPKQDHVSRLLVDYALTGARVVRLKSGDCGIFGRLEEEIIALRAAGIGYEIIPGVTSAIGGGGGGGHPADPAADRAAGAVRHRPDVTGALPEDLNMAALADPQATTVVFMGKRTFAELAAPADRGRAGAGHPGASGRKRLHPRAEARARHARDDWRALIADEAGDGPALILYRSAGGGGMSSITLPVCRSCPPDGQVWPTCCGRCTRSGLPPTVARPTACRAAPGLRRWPFAAPARPPICSATSARTICPTWSPSLRLYAASPDGTFADARPLGALREKAIARIPG